MENLIDFVSMGEIAKKLHVKRSVVRVWSKAFGIKASKSENGEKFYTSEDLDAFSKIKQSFATQKESGEAMVMDDTQIMPALEDHAVQTLQSLPEDLNQKLSLLRQQLVQLKNFLN